MQNKKKYKLVYRKQKLANTFFTALFSKFKPKNASNNDLDCTYKSIINIEVLGYILVESQKKN